MPRSTQFTFHALTPARWDDFVALFGPRGACGGCWCQWWHRARREFIAGKGADNRRAMRARVKAGRLPGILAYRDGVPVGWCAVEPRENYSGLARSRILVPVDDQPVWSVVCFFVAREARRTGLTVALLRAAQRHVAAQGGRILEGYPVEPRAGAMADAFAWTGLAAAFRKAGFREVARRSPTRPIMRWEARD